MKRGDLPVFTSTSAIPFGVNRRINGESKVDEVKNENGDDNGKETMKEEQGTPGGKEVDIWEVPETPEGKRPGGN